MLCAQNLRQLLVSTGMTVSIISDGFIVGQMSGMINGLGSNSTDTMSLTADEISWMASSINILSILGLAIMGTVADVLGRRKSFICSGLLMTTCWIIIYYAPNKTLLFISCIIQGMCYGGVLSLLFLSIAEYRPPHNRASCVTLIANVMGLVGTSLGHILSILMNWRQVALIGVIPSSLSLIIPLFWVESPTWLASKGRFEESKEAFNALHAPSETSSNQLRLLLACERMKRNQMAIDERKFVLGKKILKALKETYFWKLFIFTTVLIVYKVASGRILFNTLAITIMQDITGTHDILFFTLVVDGLSIFGAAISCYFLKRFYIRHLFFSSGIVANIVLIATSLCLYLCPETGSYIWSWIKVCLLGIYFVSTMAGPYPVLDILLSELLPTQIKSFCIFILGMLGGLLQFLTVKLTPNMLAAMGYYGIFMLNAFIIFLSLLYLWFYMPETKGRTLQEIEYYFKNNYKFLYNKETLKSDQLNDMVNKGFINAS